MSDQSKTKEQLIDELRAMRQQIAELEKEKIKRKYMEELLSRQQKDQQVIFDAVPAMIFFKNTENRFVRVNRALAEASGMTVEQMEGESCFELFPDLADKYWHDDKEVMATGVPKRDIIESMTTSDGVVWVKTDKIPCRDEKDNVVGIIGFAIDITNLKNTENTLKEELLFLETLIDTIPYPIFFKNIKGEYTGCNNSFATYLGITKEEILGKTGCDLYPKELADTHKERDQELFDHLSVQVYEAQARFANGTLHDVVFNKATFNDGYGNTSGLVGVMLDITDRKQMEKALQLHGVIMANLAEGVYLIRASDGVILYANPRFEEMFGYGHDELIGKNVSLVNAPDERSSEEIAKEIKESLNKNKVWAGEIKNIKKDGTRFFCYASVTTFDHPDYGTVWVSVHTDSTQRRQAEEALKESEAKYCDFYENAPDMYFSLDLAAGAAIKECNKTLLQTTGYSKEELIGRPIFELYDSSSIEEAKKTLQQFKAIGEVHNVERRVKCKDGRVIDVSMNVTAIKDKNGKITHSRSIWRDITERKKHEEMIRALSITDQLTGLFNRRGFTTLAEQQLRIAERTGNGIVLLFADVDDLKTINDKLGHNSGDEAIVEAANVLKEVFRKMDIIARMGGDEFAVLAPDASLEYSDMIKNRLQDQLDIHNARASRNYNLSLSIGMVYHNPSTPSTLDELISRADLLMYEQKRSKTSLEAF